MKSRIITLVMGFSLLFSTHTEAKGGFWKILGKAVGAVTEAAGGAVLQQTAMASGYTQEQSQQFVRDAYNTLNLNTRNAELGMSYINADNKYEQHNAIKEIAFDATLNISDNPALVEKLRTMTDAQLTYLSETQKAITLEEKKAVFDKRTRAYADLFYDSYQEGKEKQAVYLAEKLHIQDLLLRKGYSDPKFAEDVAGSIIAIQRSKLSKEEKEEILRSYGFSENPAQIQQYVNDVMSNDYATSTVKAQELARYKAIEEARRQGELQKQEAERKAVEERKNAIQKISTTKIDGYAFDETNLSENQKLVLDGVADILNRYSEINVLLNGNTCNIGYKSINQKKGLTRAEAAKRHLVDKGISPDRIHVDSKGESQPLVKNDSEENRKINRRVEFIVE